MSQNGGAMEAPDFHLPDEVLAVIPTDPYDQLDLARKITSMAIASRVSNLESETTRLKQKVYDQDRLIFELEEKASRLQQVFQDADSRLKLVHDENMKLVQERDSLSATVKKLNRDLGKLETFKRQLMQSLNEDTSAEAVDIGTCDQSVPRAYPEKDDGANGHTRHYSYNGSAESRYSSDDMKQTGQRFSLTPYQITPRLTPTGTPKVISTSGSPRSYSAVGSPQKNSGATTPTKMQYDGRTSLSSWYPSSQQSSAANSPPRVRALPSRTPRIDGKEFFRQARSRLSYEQFSAFLANIKQLNDHKQSREETLRKADEILGTDNKDLYLSFQGLLNRNVN
ncbi:hypothetical protein SOVF_049850 isoform A [Spinacia oleracea]|uniref:Uncharacterized protein At4g15545 isoform X2 n=1 Tax=Spinacia oleracea TaxID=3562 RepID=A0A9R0HW16_SPIOL|nr:uncharacterized protein At4g15545 isoform X2 [Spinacia oleracea]KNA20696.1 hypothetical protein SOVF_049850 isoform A [Spinacia oleracea]